MLHFHIHQKLNHDFLDLLNKPKIVRSCIFPLANLYFEVSVDSCLNRMRKSDRFYCVFVLITHNRSAHFCNKSQFSWRFEFCAQFIAES